MKSKKAMASIIPKIIIIVLVLVISLYGISKAYSTMYSGFKDWNSLTNEEQEEVQTNFEIFIEKVKECKNIKDSFCRCENVLSNFPNSFKEEISIEVSQESSNFYITPKYKGNIIGDKKDLGIGGFGNPVDIERGMLASVTENNDNIEEIRRGDKELKLTFDKNYPEVKGLKKYQITSGDIFRRDYRNILYFIIEDKKFLEQETTKEFFDKYPICMTDRTSALNQYHGFLWNIKNENEITISLPENYKIFYRDKFILLKHGENNVERIYILDNQKRKIKIEDKEVAMETYEFSIKCLNSGEGAYLVNGDKIKINNDGNTFCIEKI